MEIDLQGNILTRFENGPIETTPGAFREGLGKGGFWSVGGLEIDPLTGNLWVAVEPEFQDTIEVDITTGLPTGITFPGFVETPNRQGGIVGLPLGDPGTYPGFYDLVVFTNVAGDDFFTVHRLHQYPGLHGLREPLLQGSTGNVALGSPSPIPYTSGGTLNLLINTEGRGSFAGTFRPDFPAILLFDFGVDTLSDAEFGTDPGLGLGVLPELHVHSFLSNPASTTGDLQVPWSTGQLLQLPLTNFPVDTGDRIRIQAVYFEPFSQYSPGLMVTNEIWWSGVGINTVLVEAIGSNSFGIYPDGFFRVTWLDGPPIAKVLFHLRNTQSNTDLLNARFDTDEDAMNDVFGMGRGIDPMGNMVDLGGCDGTYRNDSDLTTGLVYDAANQAITPNGSEGKPSAACTYWLTDQGYSYNSGFVSHGGNPDSFHGLEFNFTDFGLNNGAPLGAGETESFGFDCDTDGVVTRGGGHLGMVITITLDDMASTVLEAELLPDPEDRNRSFIAW